MDAHRHGGTPVIGVDRAGGALEAVRWGAAEARRRNGPLRMVAAFARDQAHGSGRSASGAAYRKAVLGDGAVPAGRGGCGGCEDIAPRTSGPTVKQQLVSGSRAVEARWTGPDGVLRTDRVSVTGGTMAGTEVTVWLDRDGAVVDPPVSGFEAFAAAALTAGGVLLAGGSALIILWMRVSSCDRRGQLPPLGPRVDRDRSEVDVEVLGERSLGADMSCASPFRRTGTRQSAF